MKKAIRLTSYSFKEPMNFELNENFIEQQAIQNLKVLESSYSNS